MPVAAELGDDAKHGRSRCEFQCAGFFDKCVALAQKGERWLAIVEACLGSLEQVEPAVTVEIDP